MSAPPTRVRSILMIAYTYYESDTRVIREAEAACEAGFAVDVLALRGPKATPTEEIRGVRVIRLNQNKYRGKSHFAYVWAYLQFFVRALVACTEYFRRHRYHVIHVNNMPDFLVFCTVIPRLFGAKTILDIHDPMPNTLASKFRHGERGLLFQFLLWQERVSAAYAHRVLTVHEPVKRGILLKHGLRADTIDVIANFADEKLFPLRKSFEPSDRPRFVFHGTILERSGLRLLIEALTLSKHKARISVKIIGEGDFSHDLRAMISARGLELIVEFDNRSYPAHRIADQLRDCNVGIVPLDISSVTNYALPLKLVEYISIGLPVLTVRNEAIKFYLGEEDCMFYSANCVQSLSAAIDRIAEHPDLLEFYRQRSLAVRQRFLWAPERDKYVALLTRLSGAARGGQ